MYLTPEIFNGCSGVVAGFSTRRGGTSPVPYDSLNLGLSTADDDARVQANRRRLFGAAGVSVDRLAIAGQVHGVEVRDVSAPGLYPGYDGLVTAAPDLVLCISAADCAAVLLADPAARVVGACHAGWRGAAGGIVARTVTALARLGARADRLRAYVSPCISMRHFEVGPEVATRFAPAVVHHLPGEPKPRVDLKAALVAQLHAAGLDPAHVERSPRCTFAETDTFFSHRAEHGLTGRMMGFIGLTNGTVDDRPRAR